MRASWLADLAQLVLESSDYSKMPSSPCQIFQKQYIFGGSKRGAITFLASLSNIDGDRFCKMIECFLVCVNRYTVSLTRDVFLLNYQLLVRVPPVKW